MRNLGDPIKKPGTAAPPIPASRVIRMGVAIDGVQSKQIQRPQFDLGVKPIGSERENLTGRSNIQLQQMDDELTSLKKAAAQTGQTELKVAEDRRITSPKDQGVIREPEQQGVISKTLSILGSPVEAAGFYNKTGRVPDNFDRSPDQGNATDNALDIVNPAAWANYGKNAVIDASQGNIVGAGLNALGAIPGMALNKPLVGTVANKVSEAAQGISHSTQAATAVASQSVRPAMRTFRETADLPLPIRIKNAYNSGAYAMEHRTSHAYGGNREVEFSAPYVRRRPGDPNISSHGYDADMKNASYFKMTPDEVAFRLKQDMDAIPTGGVADIKNMSSDSAPIYINTAARAAKDGVTTPIRLGGSSDFTKLNSHGSKGRITRNAARAVYESFDDAQKFNISGSIDVATRRLIRNQEYLNGKKLASGGRVSPSADRIAQENVVSETVANHLTSGMFTKQAENLFKKKVAEGFDSTVSHLNKSTGLNFPKAKAEEYIPGHPDGPIDVMIPRVVSIKGTAADRYKMRYQAQLDDIRSGSGMFNKKKSTINLRRPVRDEAGEIDNAVQRPPDKVEEITDRFTPNSKS